MTDKTPLDCLLELLQTPSSNEANSMGSTNIGSDGIYGTENCETADNINEPKTPENLSKLAIKNLSSSSSS